METTIETTEIVQGHFSFARSEEIVDLGLKMTRWEHPEVQIVCHPGYYGTGLRSRALHVPFSIVGPESEVKKAIETMRETSENTRMGHIHINKPSLI